MTDKEVLIKWLEEKATPKLETSMIKWVEGNGKEMTNKEVLKKWLEGTSLESRPKDSRAYWIKVPDFKENESWSLSSNHEYRVQIPVKTCRVALMTITKDTHFPVLVETKEEAAEIAKSSNFSNWATDWIEYT